jgi:hypothetical protein
VTAAEFPPLPASFLIETSVEARLTDNLLHHAQIIYRIGPESSRADLHRTRFPHDLDHELSGAIANSALRDNGPAASVLPRLLVLTSDDPSLDGLHRALTRPRIAPSGGIISMPVARGVLQLSVADLELVWRACAQLHAAHFGAHWTSRQPELASFAQQMDDQLIEADLARKLADLTTREPSHADIQVYLLDSEALLSFSGGGNRMCLSTAALTRPERFMYLFAHECARLYLHNPPWWEVEPCASACSGLPAQLIDAVEACAAQYLAATLALRYGHDPGFWMVHPQVEDAIAQRWPGFVASPGRGIDLLLEQAARELRKGAPSGLAVKPRRLAVTYDEVGMPVACSVAPQRF